MAEELLTKEQCQAKARRQGAAAMEKAMKRYNDKVG